jgi:hypothetical protein
VYSRLPIHGAKKGLKDCGWVSDYTDQMAMEAHRGHQLKRIVLPSGKTIEVVYFDQVEHAEDNVDAAQARTQEQRTERELHVCPECESDLVYPTTWEEADERHWSVSLRCPNCEHFEQGVYSQDECDRFDDHLEAGTDALTRDFKRLMAANMAEEIDRFVAALDADAIQPMDF